MNVKLESSLEHDQQVNVSEEQPRRARELHDSVNQLIFGMTLIAQSLGSAYQHDPAEGEKRLVRLLELSQRVRSEMKILLEILLAGPEDSQ